MDANPSSDVAEVRRRLREQMPVARKWAYFDHAAVAAITAPGAEAMTLCVQQSLLEGDTAWPEWGRKLRETRLAAARLINAEPEEIALTPNTTAGINFVAEGLDWRAGDNIVTLADEYPSNLYPWMQQGSRGVETRLVPTDDGRVDYDQFADYCDDRTRVITVSWVAFSNGCRRDLKTIGEIARRCGALYFVDAIQGLGAFPLDVRQSDIDFLSADGHKWMLGHEGAGMAFIRRDRLSQLRAIGVGAHSVVHEQDYTRIELRLKENASRYEGGSINVPGMLGWGASLGLLQEIGIERIAAAVLDITDQICERLTELGLRVVSPRTGEERSGIVSFEFPDVDLLALRRHCLQQGVALACRAGRVRVSPHGYNNHEDVDRLIAALRSYK